MFQMRKQRNNQLIIRTLIFILTACTNGNNPFPGAAGGGIKFTQAQLSSLGRQEYGGGSASNGGGGSGSSTNGGAGSVGSAVAGGTAAAGGGEVLVPKSFPLSGQEPTCEELRAMWIFSKRQSRAAEITNEIPTYRDPFAYNIWEPYYSTTRSLGGLRMVSRYGDRSRSPVFGRIISREPILASRLPLRPRHLGELQTGATSRIYGSETKPLSMGALPRRQMQFRFGGGSNAGAGNSGTGGNGGAATNSVAVQGSFQKLKELIWTERAKELTQQRRAEELAARAAVLKEIANGQNIQAPNYKHQLKSESPLMDENRSPDQDMYQHPADQQRISIANGQSTNGRHSNGGGGNSGTRGGKLQKTAMFSSNPASNSGRAGRLLLPSMVVSGYGGHADEVTHERGSGNVGVAKAFPMRPSHFRERNRSLFKQPSSHPDYFRRDQRRFFNSQLMNVNLATDAALRRLNVARLLALQEASALPNRNFVYLSSTDDDADSDSQQLSHRSMRQLTDKQYDNDQEQDQSEDQENVWNFLSALPYDAAAKSGYSDADQIYASSLESEEN